MAWKSGQSGNPKGRPPDDRALTKILQRELNKTKLPDGDKAAAKTMLARNLADALMTGVIVFPDGSKMVLDMTEYLALAKWVYNHIDGGPVQRHDVSGEMAIIWDIPTPQPPESQT